MKVLIVDDTKDNLDLLGALLSAHGYEVSKAINGKDALEQAYQSPPELIISDILMPVMDGFALCREWKQAPSLKDIPFIFYTATYTEQKDHDFALSLGAECFLIKPMENYALLGEILKVVTQQQEGKSPPETPLPHQTTDYYQQYNARLVNKLENKHKQLEINNQQLIQQNRQLQESEARVQLLLDSTAEGVLGLDTKGCCSFANQACLRMLGYHDVAQLLNKSMHALMQHSYSNSRPYPKEKSRIREAYLEGKDVHCDSEVLWRSDGSQFAVEYWAYPIHKAGDCIGAVVTFLDITPRKQAEEALHQYRDQLENTVQQRTHELLHARDEALQANRAKSMFLANVSHELRTPMNAILGFSQLLDTEDLSESQADFVQEISLAGHHLLDLINEVLDLSSIEAGKLNLKFENSLLSELVMDCITMVQPMAMKKNIQIDNRIDAAEKMRLHVDRLRFKEVLVNLLGNAVKYNSKNGNIIINSQIANQGAIRINVMDDGPGMSVEQQELVFEPFNRLGAEYSDIEGTGIGLTIVKKLVSLMRGRVGVQSIPGQGCTFWIEYPLIVEDGALATKHTQQGTTVIAKPAPQQSVLYVEDNPANLRLVQHIFERIEDVVLYLAPNAELGIELAKAKQPDLILLDINLPGMDGYEALSRLRNLDATRGIPIIAVSAAAMPRDIERGLAAGFKCYITKPIQVAGLMEAITGELGQVQKQQNSKA